MSGKWGYVSPLKDPGEVEHYSVPGVGSTVYNGALQAYLTFILKVWRRI